MGVDVIGLKPKSEKGEYFGSNWWYWRPIWTFTVILCEDIMNERTEMEIKDEGGNVIGKVSYFKYQAGHSNDGYIISAEDAEKIGRRIMEVLEPPSDAGKIAREKRNESYTEIASRVNRHFNAIAKTFSRMFVITTEKLYILDKDLLREWAEFCLNCGGFAVH